MCGERREKGEGKKERVQEKRSVSSAMEGRGIKNLFFGGATLCVVSSKGSLC